MTLHCDDILRLFASLKPGRLGVMSVMKKRNALPILDPLALPGFVIPVCAVALVTSTFCAPISASLINLMEREISGEPQCEVILNIAAFV